MDTVEQNPDKQKRPHPYICNESKILSNCLMTPETATIILEDWNEENVPQRMDDVNRYMQQMKAGNWVNNHPQPLIFRKDGMLQTGQHRLLALKECGLSFYFNIAVGSKV